MESQKIQSEVKNFHVYGVIMRLDGKSTKKILTAQQIDRGSGVMTFIILRKIL